MTMQQDGPPPADGSTHAPVVMAPAPQPEGPRPPPLESVAKWGIGGLLVVAIMALTFGLGFGTRMATEPSSTTKQPAQAAQAPAGGPNFDVLSEIYNDIKSQYVDANNLDPSALRQGAIDGLIKAVGDAHMGYLTQAEYLAETDDTSGAFSGIGATVEQNNGQLSLTPLSPTTPAAKAGLQAGDILLTVDGASAKGWTDIQAVQKIRGQKGTQVTIGVKHANGQQQNLTITRDNIDLPSVETTALHDANGKPVTDIAYVKIDQFSLRTPQELQTQLTSIANNKAYKGLVIDLRNNPGGVVNSVIQVAGDFVNNHDPVLLIQQKNGSDQTIRPQNNGILTQMPLAVLVNHNSASAAEILSGALRADRQAKLFGETTFGKGTENVFVPLKTDPGAISITVGRWLTPDHQSIDGTGLKPDIAVTAADNQDPNATFNNVLYRAITYLQTGS